MVMGISCTEMLNSCHLGMKMKMYSRSHLPLSQLLRARGEGDLKRLHIVTKGRESTWKEVKGHLGVVQTEIHPLVMVVVRGVAGRTEVKVEKTGMNIVTRMMNTVRGVAEVMVGGGKMRVMAEVGVAEGGEEVVS